MQSRILISFSVLTIMVAAAKSSPAQQVKTPAKESAKPVGKGASATDALESIHETYDRELLNAGRRHLGRLAALAATQKKEEAEETYGIYLRFAITGNLSADAESVAERLIQAGDSSPRLLALAQLVNLFGEVNRAKYQESLDSLVAALRENKAAAGQKTVAPLPVPAQVGLIDAYFQRLIQADQFEIARKAMELIDARSTNATVKDLASRRLGQLRMIGKLAPPIVGVDIDKKPYQLSDLKGNVILVVFWASWCLPNGEEVERLENIYSTFHERGLRIVGINLDTMQDGGQSPEAVMPHIRRFLLDHNVRWPNLINGAGDADYAKAFRVTEIPASFLIGRDGTIVHFDLTRGNLASVVAKAVGR
jgi:peroxiredoxin